MSEIKNHSKESGGIVGNVAGYVQDSGPSSRRDPSLVDGRWN
ncbi:hypothetical protein [Arthrobacter oryzae]|nr:hypothetical protein [Arthrobacter oryzae]